MNQTKQQFYKKVLDQFFLLDAKKQDFGEIYSETDLKQKLDLENPEKQGNKDYNDVLGYLEKYIRYSLKTDHSQFLNRMWTGANTPGIAGEMVTALQQTSACTYESAPVSTLMEKYMIQEMLELVGFQNGEGQMTTGSSNANMIAMMTARNLQSTDIKQQGLFTSQKMYGFVNEESHYSLDKATNILGIGADQLIKVQADANGAMDIDVLKQLLKKYRQEGKVFFVAATAGTTVRGAYDPIEALLKLREKYGFWLHVDGAWGGPVFLDEKLRKKFLRGIEKVDSFCFDFHKMPGVALICNMLLINNKKGVLEHNCNSGNTDYIFKDLMEQDEKLSDNGDLGVQSLQCGRRVDSLKLFLDWKYYGPEGFAQKISYYHDMCCYAQKYIESSKKLSMAFERVSFNICFVYSDDSLEQQNSLNQKIREELYSSGQSLVGSATIQGKYFLRLLICNEHITKHDIETFFSNVISAGNKIVATG